MSLVLIAGATTQAAEQVVKNDSITDGSLAVICPCFAVNECAAAWLTSPCNGNIVAVQVFWRSQYGGQPLSLEESITIYAAGTFPTPGAIMQNNYPPYQNAVLEGPVLTDGVLNEFRYLDENSTIPIQVPVTTGQRFVVSLQFANANNVPPYVLPSIVYDTNGCQAQKNTVRYASGTWVNACALGVSGDWMIRAIVNCQEPTGACCHASGVCENGKQQSQCQAYGDVWTQGQTCSQVTCTARGACCRQGGCVSLRTPAQCAALAGVYAGDGTNCADQVCVAGACCMPTGECILNFGFQCIALGGTFRGPNTTCSPTNPCPQPVGACCFGDICADDQLEADCTGAGGDWVGPFTTCGPPDPCAADPCAGTIYTLGDVNGDGAKDGRDVKEFIAQYISPTPGTVAFCAANMCATDQVIDDADLTAFVTCLLEPGTCANPGCP
jgi:hypothetical protein